MCLVECRLAVSSSKSSKSGVACFGSQAEGMDRISGFCRVGPSLEVRDRLKMLRMPFSVRGLVSVALVLTADGERDFEPDHGPVEDLDLLFTLLDTESKGTARNRLKPCQFGLWESCLEDPKVNTDMFFRGCAKLRTDSGPGTRHCDFDEWSRGPAMACDLHQLSIDLKHNLAQALPAFRSEARVGSRAIFINGAARSDATTTRSAYAKSTRPWRLSWIMWMMPAAKSP